MQRQETRQKPTCGTCGRALGVGYYWTCHTCGATFCYVHIPESHKHGTSAPQV
jgi:tRNA(Ile2) C34 agmatinyltransferase TiaS